MLIYPVFDGSFCLSLGMLLSPLYAIQLPYTEKADAERNGNGFPLYLGVL